MQDFKVGDKVICRWNRECSGGTIVKKPLGTDPVFYTDDYFGVEDSVGKCHIFHKTRLALDNVPAVVKLEESPRKFVVGDRVSTPDGIGTVRRLYSFSDEILVYIPETKQNEGDDFLFDYLPSELKLVSDNKEQPNMKVHSKPEPTDTSLLELQLEMEYNCKRALLKVRAAVDEFVKLLDDKECLTEEYKQKVSGIVNDIDELYEEM